MKMKKEDIPVVMEAPGMIMRSQAGLGSMTVVFHELPKGTDFTPLLRGLDNNNCHCPHWGYIFEGAFRFIYDDGTQELFEAGDVFYAQPGHTAIVDKDLKFIDFSPTKELAQVMSNVDKVMAEMA
ncbi:hypothetical protein [Paraglaciecola chathamensis]|uniref:Cupin domain-containing protein n=1 Tax=Paraglaciecola chathamensis TaxID=368405 RepID=A0A8H9II93_9ALTE|nr:hypothetical protein [Paraglaciecola oceanifecundans]GGZ82549.1 hypothetical protein GCM10011274_45390 [Paraglaciecola oceanifecundans]